MSELTTSKWRKFPEEKPPGKGLYFVWDYGVDIARFKPGRENFFRLLTDDMTQEEMKDARFLGNYTGDEEMELFPTHWMPISEWVESQYGIGCFVPEMLEITALDFVPRWMKLPDKPQSEEE